MNVRKKITRHLLDPFIHGETQQVTVTSGAYAVAVKKQGSTIALFFEEDEDESRTETRTFFVFGTGETIPWDQGSFFTVYVGTVMLCDDTYVAHVYERERVVN